MLALLEPSEELIRVEHEGNLTRRLTLSEEMKSMPFGLVWDMFCEMEGVAGSNWLDQYN